MNIIYLLAPLALLLGLFFATGFVTAVLKGQFDDTDTPPQKMLLDDEPVTDDLILKGKHRD